MKPSQSVQPQGSVWLLSLFALVKVFTFSHSVSSLWGASGVTRLEQSDLWGWHQASNPFITSCFYSDDRTSIFPKINTLFSDIILVSGSLFYSLEILNSCLKMSYFSVYLPVASPESMVLPPLGGWVSPSWQASLMPESIYFLRSMAIPCP